MAFRVMARTVLQLGAELISSDAVAFYELIKNAFDAGSPRVNIDAVVRLDHDFYVSQCEFIRQQLKEDRSRSPDEVVFEDCKDQILNGLDPSAPHISRLREGIEETETWEGLLDELDGANYIRIRDTGSGMSLADLEEIYLTIGTRNRSDQSIKQQETMNGSGNGVRPVLGEKGIGRLSTMRLGWRLRVSTTKAGESRWNILEIDWRKFAEPSELLVEDIEIIPTTGKSKKNDPDYSGTQIRISALTSEWTAKKLKDIAAAEFSKLTSPFTPRSRYPISVRFNDNPVVIPRFDKVLFEHAHAAVKAEFVLEADGPRFYGTVNYSLRKREKLFSMGQPELLSATQANSPSVLESVGPFSVEFYWFNRRLLAATEGIGDRTRVLALVRDWAGGLMLFRDGFRVHPYGNPDDDWVDLDRRALASQGYKVSRRQIIGQVSISSRLNPGLRDQTNREGLRATPEKDVLVKLLKHLFEVQFRAFLNEVDKEMQSREPVTFDELEERALGEEREMRQYLNALFNKYPELKKDRQIVRPIENSVRKIRAMMEEASELAESYEKGHTQLLNLAGLGLMVEIVAHELNMATVHALGALDATNVSGLTPDMSSMFGTLESQLKTLQKRLRILDPLSTAARQVKVSFDLIDWVDGILQSHQAQSERHDIKFTLRVEPSESKKRMPVKMVQGMVTQIMENLLHNSVYWLKQQRKWVKSFKPEITVTINTETKKISVTDNGPGVDIDMKEEIFQPFVTYKPPGEGKGLGLYISREIAKYNGASLEMSEESAIHPDRLNTFVLSLEVVEQ